MARFFPDLDPKKIGAIETLMTTGNRREACKVIGISERQLYTWFQQPDFAAAYRKAQRDLWEHTMGRIQDLAGAATRVLSEVMENSEERGSTRVAAARAVLDAAAKGIASMDEADKVQEISEKLDRYINLVEEQNAAQEQSGAVER